MKNVKEIKMEVSQWWYGVTWRAKRNFEATKEWCEKNPAMATAIASGILVGLKGAGKLVHSVDRKIDMKHQQKLMDERIYVPSLHKHVVLRRPMTRYETIEYDRRKASGESIISILYDMGLLK